ncbi:hypothetical protein SISSUDRAFT_519490 [Sistotremastrum suecicum HHB10207 ss-3]|uniref:Uncharacterized protein n=1 Tax=Sistotremastrum suecicum HHB10207 ss-3 TaxID=1314776 RepID=A0A165XYT3_9AGAM|nr:hypothetical protein SISSUDRAFT_519490 [Sistotremastrum suecicum HHB10207 ss-3]
MKDKVEKWKGLMDVPWSSQIAIPLAVWTAFLLPAAQTFSPPNSTNGSPNNSISPLGNALLGQSSSSLTVYLPQYDLDTSADSTAVLKLLPQSFAMRLSISYQGQDSSMSPAHFSHTFPPEPPISASTRPPSLFIGELPIAR